MKTASLLASLATLSFLATSCDLGGCDKAPQPRCTAGTVLRQTCMAGTLIQLENSSEGQTITYNFDGAGPKTYHNVISTYSALGTPALPGTKVYFTLKKGGSSRQLQCTAADAPTGMAVYTLQNVSSFSCDEQPTHN